MTTDYNGNTPGVIHHARESRRLIRQARYELEKKGDRVQASEKAAGAVSHAVKAVAEARHWHHDSHNRRRHIVDFLAAEFGVPEWSSMHDIADQLHDNCCKDMMFYTEVQVRLHLITALWTTFIELLERQPNPNFILTPDQELMLSRLRLTAAEIADRANIE